MNKAGLPAAASGDGLSTNPVRWPHRVGWLLILVVFPLIWVGGLVTTTDAGMAVPDWPNTYGYNMFAYPLYDWFFGPWDLFVEHGHRLLGTIAGIVSIVLLAVTWRSPASRGLRWYAVGLLAMVILQGSLGGARVLMDARDVARLHGCLGPAYFAMVGGFVAATGAWWFRSHAPLAAAGRTSRVARMAQILLVLAFLQLVLGAYVRHLPESSSPRAFSHLVWLHVGGAIVVATGSLLTWIMSRATMYRGSGLRGPVTAGMLLVLCQFCLGLATWVAKYGWPAWMDRWGWAASWVIPEKSLLQTVTVTLHVAVGSLILVAWTVAAVRGWKLKSASPDSARVTGGVGSGPGRNGAGQGDRDSGPLRDPRPLQPAGQS